MSPIVIAVLLAWLACTILAAGISFAYLQGRYPSIATQDYREDMGVSWLFAIVGGPLAFIVILFTTGFAKYGVRWK